MVQCSDLGEEDEETSAGPRGHPSLVKLASDSSMGMAPHKIFEPSMRP